MIDWWNSLTIGMQILWAITLSASLIFVIQTIMTFLGADGGSDFDIDTGGHTDIDMGSSDDPNSGMGLLTFRNFVNFFLGFGWTAILLGKEISSASLLIVISSLVGVGLVALVMLLFKWLSSMQQSGNIDVFKSSADCHGTVYLTIPGHREGEGKVQISIKDSIREYQALTDGDTLKTGTRIRVVEAISANTLLVEEIESIII